MSDQVTVADSYNKIIVRRNKANAVYFKESRRVIVVADEASFYDIELCLERLKSELQTLESKNDRLAR